MKISFTGILFFITLFLFSYVLGGFADAGDAAKYQQYYTAMASTSFQDIVKTQLTYLSSADIFYGFFIYIFSHIGLDRDLCLSFVNSMFLFLFYKLLRSRKLPPCVCLMAIFSFHSFALLFFLERLKISLLMIFIALLLPPSKYLCRSISVFCSFLAHPQILILIASRYSSSLLSFLVKGLDSLRITVKHLILFISLLFFLPASLLLSTRLISKVLQYMDIQYSFQQYFPLVIALFILLTMGSFSPPRIVSVFVYLISALIIGPIRLSIMVFFEILYYANLKNSYNRLFLACALLYLDFKGLLFLFSMIRTGDGYNF